MAQFARPIADLSAGVWTTTPLWSKIDEAPGAEDATYAISDGTPTTAEPFAVDLSSLTDPASSIGHIIRCRWSKNTSTGLNYRGVCQLRQGYVNESSQGTLIATLTGAALQNALTTQTYTLSSGEADAITNYADLQFRIYAEKVGGGGNDAWRVEWVEFEVPDAAGGSPVVVSLTPAGVGVGAQASSPSLGALAVALTPAAVSVGPQSHSPSLAAKAVQSAPAGLAVSGQGLSPSLAAKAVQASPANIAVSSQIADPTLAGKVVSASPAVIGVAASLLDAVLAALAVEASPATITVVPSATNPTGSEAPRTITAAPAVLSVSPQALAVVLDNIAIQSAPAGISVGAQALNPTLSSFAVQLSPGTLSVSPQTLSPGGALAIQFVPAVIATQAQPFSPVFSGISISAMAAMLNVGGQLVSPTLAAKLVQLSPALLQVGGQVIAPIIVGIAPTSRGHDGTIGMSRRIITLNTGRDPVFFDILGHEIEVNV